MCRWEERWHDGRGSLSRCVRRSHGMRLNRLIRCQQARKDFADPLSRRQMQLFLRLFWGGEKIAALLRTLYRLKLRVYINSIRLNEEKVRYRCGYKVSNKIQNIYLKMLKRGIAECKVTFIRRYLIRIWWRGEVMVGG